MKSLYESILSSTKSGANLPLTLDYLLKRSYRFEDGPTHNDTIIVKDGLFEDSTTHVLHYKEFNGKMYIWIRIYKYSKFFPKWIETIKDLELVENLWDCRDRKDKKGSEKALDKILKDLYNIPKELNR